MINTIALSLTTLLLLSTAGDGFGFTSRKLSQRDRFALSSRNHISSSSFDIGTGTSRSIDIEISTRHRCDDSSTDTGKLITALDKNRNAALLSLIGFLSGIVTDVAQGYASSDEYEIAELPPPYIPAIFGFVLLGGVGLLTSSLGNVMDEEASLGLQSGARAKKEIERSKSSYFGRRR